MSEQASTMKIIILGSGVTAWMVAAALSRRLRGVAEVVVVEAGTPPFPSIETTLSTISRFHETIGFPEDSLICSGGGAFSLGTVLTGWAGIGRSHIQPFGEIGAPIGPVAFHQVVARLRASGETVRLADYSLAALLAQANRFGRPAEDARSVLSTYDYGLIIDSRAYANLLRSMALKAGAEVRSPATCDVVRLEDGSISSVKNADGEVIAGDLFIDCTEVKEISSLSASHWLDWSSYLPCDRILAAERQTDEPIGPFAHVEAHAAGFSRNLSLPGRLATLLVYSGAHLSDERASDNLERAGYYDLLLHPLRPGRRRRAWTGNSIAIGASATVLDPLQPTQLHLTQSAILRLLKLLPSKKQPAVEAEEFNRQTAEEADRALDFHVLHYKTNGRTSETFWEQCRNMTVPESLSYKMEVYSSRGKVVLQDHEVFDEQQWIMLMDEQGVIPRRYDAMADAIPMEKVGQHLGRIRKALIGAVREVPPAALYTHQLCASRLGDA